MSKKKEGSYKTVAYGIAGMFLIAGASILGVVSSTPDEKLSKQVRNIGFIGSAISLVLLIWFGHYILNSADTEGDTTTLFAAYVVGLLLFCMCMFMSYISYIQDGDELRKTLYGMSISSIVLSVAYGIYIFRKVVIKEVKTKGGIKAERREEKMKDLPCGRREDRTKDCLIDGKYNCVLDYDYGEDDMSYKQIIDTGMKCQDKSKFHRFRERFFKNNCKNLDKRSCTENKNFCTLTDDGRCYSRGGAPSYRAGAGYNRPDARYNGGGVDNRPGARPSDFQRNNRRENINRELERLRGGFNRYRS